MLTTISPLLRGRATIAWVVLIAATLVSWWLGTDHALARDDRELAGVLVLLVAFFKVRLVGLYFMELREAPAVLRLLFEAYCALVCAMVVVLYLVL